MSLKIRLARGGAKKRPYYSIVVADSRSPRDGRFIEKLGTYNPMLDRSHADRVTLKSERIQHWLGVGAQPTDLGLRLGHLGGHCWTGQQRDLEGGAQLDVVALISLEVIRIAVEFR